MGCAASAPAESPPRAQLAPDKEIETDTIPGAQGKPAKIQQKNTNGKEFLLVLDPTTGTWRGSKKIEIYHCEGQWRRCGTTGRHEVWHFVDSPDCFVPPMLGWQPGPAASGNVDTSMVLLNEQDQPWLLFTDRPAKILQKNTNGKEFRFVLDPATGSWRAGMKEIFYDDGQWRRCGTDGRREVWAFVKSNDSIVPPSVGWKPGPAASGDVLFALTYLDINDQPWPPAAPATQIVQTTIHTVTDTHHYHDTPVATPVATPVGAGEVVPGIMLG